LEQRSGGDERQKKIHQRRKKDHLKITSGTQPTKGKKKVVNECKHIIAGTNEGWEVNSRKQKSP